MRLISKLFFLFCFVLSLNSLDLTTYKNSRGDISFDYPNNWFVKEVMFNNPYNIFISDVEIKKDTDIFKTGITITKFYHQSWQFKFNSDIDKSLEEIKMKSKEVILSNKNHKIISEDFIINNGIKFLKVIYEFNGDNENLVITNYYTIFNDSYLEVILEAPKNMINEYNDYFNNFISKTNFFTTEKNDNDIVDSQSFKITKDFMSLDIDNKNITQYLDLMSLSIKMNPFFPYNYYSRGLFYMKLCQNLKNKEQKDIANNAIDDLTKASDFFVKYGKDITDEKNIKFPLTQCYFSIAELYLNAFKDKKNAKIFYKKALEITDSEQIKKILNSL
jgi:hypothetical protein